MLNRLWGGLFLVAAVAALWQWLIAGQTDVFAAMVTASFDMAKLSVDVALMLIGLLCFWLGLLKIADHSGVTVLLAKALSPLFARLTPDIPRGHPAIGSMAMNCAANMLGLDNAATPIGLRAMRELQSCNPSPDSASSAQMLFMVLNTAAITLFPVTVMMYRAQAGSADPSSVFLPVLLASACGTFAGVAALIWHLRLPVWDKVVAAYVGGLLGVMALLLLPAWWLPRGELAGYSSALGNGLLLLAIMSLMTTALWRRLPVFELFIDGAKEGFQLAVSLIPYLVAMLVVIGLLRASGALPLLLDGVRLLVESIGWDTRFIDALPVGLMKILSGSGARALMIDTLHQHGADSLAGLAASVMQGSSETTFYVLAVYGGAVGLKRMGAALPCALFADLVGIVAAVLICYWFFG